MGIKLYTKKQWKTENHFNFKYVEYLPENFENGKKYPLVFFLHGAGERGEDLDAAMRYGYMKYVREEGKNYPFIFIAPVCPKDKYWGCYTESLIAFLDYITDSLPVDKERIYLTGLSMGGTGTWMLAMACPEKFAALMPVCGSGICWYGEAVKDIPIYIFHGDCDATVPISESITMMSKINGMGGNAKIKICYGVDHNAWDYAYTDDEAMEWMLSQRLSDRVKKDN